MSTMENIVNQQESSQSDQGNVQEILQQNIEAESNNSIFHSAEELINQLSDQEILELERRNNDPSPTRSDAPPYSEIVGYTSDVPAVLATFPDQTTTLNTTDTEPQYQLEPYVDADEETPFLYDFDDMPPEYAIDFSEELPSYAQVQSENSRAESAERWNELGGECCSFLFIIILMVVIAFVQQN
ncbi:hypothetical protein BC833DRAFT_605220 [Globomyces pollinis-pini]|nr:hypothetical protein BC833DRAFT_605220 [Globomyces pollinis-pini]